MPDLLRPSQSTGSAAGSGTPTRAFNAQDFMREIMKSANWLHLSSDTLNQSSVSDAILSYFIRQFAPERVMLRTLIQSADAICNTQLVTDMRYKDYAFMEARIFSLVKAAKKLFGSSEPLHLYTARLLAITAIRYKLMIYSLLKDEVGFEHVPLDPKDMDADTTYFPKELDPKDMAGLQRVVDGDDQVFLMHLLFQTSPDLALSADNLNLEETILKFQEQANKINSVKKFHDINQACWAVLGLYLNVYTYEVQGSDDDEAGDDAEVEVANFGPEHLRTLLEIATKRAEELDVLPDGRTLLLCANTLAGSKNPLHVMSAKMLLNVLPELLLGQQKKP